MPKIKNWSKQSENTWLHEPTGSRVKIEKTPSRIVKKYNVTEPYRAIVHGSGSNAPAGTEDIGRPASTKEQARKRAIGYMKRNKGERLSMP